jgi:hypothetical protein
VYRFFSVIPGRAQREPGIHRAAETVDQWIPGLRQVAHPQMRNCASGNDVGQARWIASLSLSSGNDGVERDPTVTAM